MFPPAPVPVTMFPVVDIVPLVTILPPVMLPDNDSDAVPCRELPTVNVLNAPLVALTLTLDSVLFPSMPKILPVTVRFLVRT